MEMALFSACHVYSSEVEEEEMHAMAEAKRLCAAAVARCRCPPPLQPCEARDTDCVPWLAGTTMTS